MQSGTGLFVRMEAMGGPRDAGCGRANGKELERNHIICMYVHYGVGVGFVSFASRVTQIQITVLVQDVDC